MKNKSEPKTEAKKVESNLFKSTSIIILRNGLKMALNHHAPEEVINSIENEIQNQKERVENVRKSDTTS